MTASRKVTARVQQRGRKFHHVVLGYDGEEVGRRVSDQRYAFAICSRRGSSVSVTRFSASDRCSDSFFAVTIEDA